MSIKTHEYCDGPGCKERRVLDQRCVGWITFGGQLPPEKILFAYQDVSGDSTVSLRLTGRAFCSADCLVRALANKAKEHSNRSKLRPTTFV